MIPFATFGEDTVVGKISVDDEPYFEMPDEILNGSDLFSRLAYSFKYSLTHYDFSPSSPYIFFNIRTAFPADSHYSRDYCFSTYYGFDLSYGYDIDFDSDWVIITFDSFPVSENNNHYNLQIYNNVYEYDSRRREWYYSEGFQFGKKYATRFSDIYNFNISEIHYNLSDSSLWGLNEDGELVDFMLNSDLSEYYDTSLGSHVIVDHVTTNIDEITSSPFDIQVNFSPALSGEVDRSFLANGQTCYSQSITMTVKNNSRTSIQYSMAIYRADDIYYDNPVFRYLSAGGFVYSSDLTNQQNYFNQVPRLFYKKSQWLYLAPHEQTVQVIKYSQLPLEQQKNYRVVVKAVATNFDYATDFVMQEFDDVYSDLYQLPSSTIVYNSVFSIKYLADCPYDYNDTSNGITPYKSNDDFQRAYYTYSQYADDNGVIQNGGFNLWDNPDSWVHHPNGTSTERIRFSDSSVDSGTFIRESNGILAFFSNFFGFLPPEIRALFTFGVTAIVAVIIIKFVRG